jgi:REP element-mobilizing transposase RayT
MCAPRPVFPDRFLFITRRCTQRQFLLRPDDETNNSFVYCLAEAAQRYELQVVLSQMMSNHHHTVLYDPFGREVEFREHLHKMIAKSQNAHRGRWENFFSSEEPSVIELVTREDLLDKLVYTATNPVKDGLVEKVHHWPGPNFVKALLTGRSMKAHRPKHFFREDGPMPAEVELVLGLPDHFGGRPEFLADLERRIAEVEEGYARARREHGRQVIGRRRVLRQSWRDAPTTFAPHRGLRPRVAARNKWLRIELLQRNKEWTAEYRGAFEKFRAGLLAVFPYGTYALKRLANVLVKPPPERYTHHF